ncbi:O-methyltransferase [bacterium]|nr:O-methyltransferase [bacterium]
MEFISEELSDYAEAFTSRESDLLAEINRDTHANVLNPRMLSGHLQGRILSLFSKLQKPRNILEIGTYTGYSALCMAEGLAEGGQLHTIDINEELETRLRSYFDRSEYKDQIRLHIGNALEIVPALGKTFDLVFIDADKENYLNYYKMIIDDLPSGALIIADNVLWSGKVVSDKERANDEETKALHEFNSYVNDDERVEQVLMPVRDGLLVIRKL